MLISFVSAKGSPGVTTTALALASQWPRIAVVLDADPFGGDVAAGIGRATWPGHASITELVVASRMTDVESALRTLVHRPAAHAPMILAGFGTVGQAAGVPWDRIAEPLSRLHDADVLADCGRFALVDGVGPLLDVSDVVVLVCRSTLRAVRATARLVAPLQDVLGTEPGDRRLALLVVGPDDPYSSEEIADGCALPLLGEIPDDPRAAEVWSDGATPGRWFPRSELQREALRLADRLAGSDADAPQSSAGRP